MKDTADNPDDTSEKKVDQWEDTEGDVDKSSQQVSKVENLKTTEKTKPLFTSTDRAEATMHDTHYTDPYDSKDDWDGK